MIEASPAHPAPDAPYRPLSGLAVFAFVASLVGGFASLVFWWIELVPFVAGIAALARVRPEVRRGRVLAIWAIVISMGVGSCFYVVTSNFKQLAHDASGSILTALSRDQATEVQRDAAISPWMYRRALEADEDLLPRIRRRFAHVEAKYGKYVPPPHVAELMDGMAKLLVPPTGFVEVTPGEAAPMVLGQAAFWVSATFGEQVVRVMFQVGDGSASFGGFQSKDHEPGKPAPLVGDVRFYVDPPARPNAEDPEAERPPQ